MNRFHIKYPLNHKGGSKINLALTVGERRVTMSFNKYQEDKSKGDYPSKTMWLQDAQVNELRSKGFVVRKASEPKPETKQVKPKKKESTE